VFIGCNVCQDLWREYAAARARHVSFERMLKRAVREGHKLDFDGFEALVNDALMTRMEIGDLIQQHRKSDHGDAGE
jgi:hypothetical protein